MCVHGIYLKMSFTQIFYSLTGMRVSNSLFRKNNHNVNKNRTGNLLILPFIFNLFFFRMTPTRISILKTFWEKYLEELKRLSCSFIVGIIFLILKSTLLSKVHLGKFKEMFKITICSVKALKNNFKTLKKFEISNAF